MCMSAIGLGGVVYGSSISALAASAGLVIDASAVRDAASFYRGHGLKSCEPN